jgi:uncharacterized membrane protein
MLAFILCLGLFIVLMSIRSRLDKAERQEQKLATTVATLASDLANQAAELQALQARFDQLRSGESAPMAQATAWVEPMMAEQVMAEPRPPHTETPPSAAATETHGTNPVSEVWFERSGRDPVAVALEFVRELLLGGNTLVRAGILVLLVGVVLLLRWASEHALFPIELRLIGAALLAMALVGVGFRNRTTKPGFARTLQGGGVAALYLVTFFAFHSYQLLPTVLAFTLLAGIALCSGVLAVAQNSLSLILIGQLFGFLAPLLASSGKGSHVGLFSYYLVLNLLVFGVAWFKAWRPLNLLGFLFTFGVATAWGALRYEPDLFASTEPFLIAFFLLYLAIPVLFALRHPTVRGGWVDGSLVFGTPLAALGLQWALVHDKPFGMAYSVLALAAVYLGLASWMRRSAPAQLGAMAESFLPIGVGFVTLAIPYGFDNHNLTGAAWALEGAGLYWVGVRQQRWLSRLAGVALQLLAGASVLYDPMRAADSLPVLNGWCLAGLLLGASSLFVAYYSHARRSQLPNSEWRRAQLLIAWGCMFILRMGLGEIDAWVPRAWRPGLDVAWLGAFALALETLGRRLSWRPGRIPALLLWPAMPLWLGNYAWSLGGQPLGHAGFVGWPIYALAMGIVLRKFVDTGPGWLGYAHPLALWLWSTFFVLVAEQFISDVARLDDNFVFAAGSGAAVAALLLLLAMARRAGWPVSVHRALYLGVGATGLAAYLMLRGLVGNLTLKGSASPLPYVPVLNPVDLAELLGFTSVLLWLRRASSEPPVLLSAPARRAIVATLVGLGFVWWNALLARSVHQYMGVALEPEALFHSTHLQVACSLSWTLIALGAMIIAHRNAARPPWVVAAVLLGVVVAKLFLLDLERLSTPAKIISFLGVGALLLLIGYVAPVPPPAADRESARPLSAPEPAPTSSAAGSDP